MFNEVEKNLRQIYVPRFWSQFNEIDNEITSFYKFKNAVENLYKELSNYITHINNIQKLNNYMLVSSNTLEHFKLVVRASLLAQLPPYHTRTLKYFYEFSFRIFCNLEGDREPKRSPNLNASNDDTQCKGCLQESDLCQCQQIYETFCDTNR